MIIILVNIVKNHYFFLLSKNILFGRRIYFFTIIEVLSRKKVIFPDGLAHYNYIVRRIQVPPSLDFLKTINFFTIDFFVFFSSNNLKKA